MTPTDHPALRAAMLGAAVFLALVSRLTKARDPWILAAVSGALVGLALAPW